MTRLAQTRRIAPVAVVLALAIRGSAQIIPTDGAPPGQRTGMILGQVVDAATGAPVAEAIVRLTMPKYLENLPTTPKGRVMADGEGRFFFADLPAGEYFVQATKDGYAPGTYGQRRAWGQSQFLALAEGERPTDVTLRVWKYGVIAGTVVDEAGEPVVGVAVRALITDVVAGRTRYGNMRVVFEGSQPTAAELQTLSFALVPPGSGGAAQTSGGGRVDAEGHFTFAGVTPDTYQFVTTWNAPGARDKWTIKSSTANGREAFEAPLRVNSNETLAWTVTFTDKPAGLTGVLTDPGGRPATDYYVLVFSSDRKYWTPGSRRVRMTRPATDGSYSVKGLPPGRYFLAAPTDLETGEWNDPLLLEQLARSSATVTLRDGEAATQDFRIGGQRSPLPAASVR